MRAFSPHLRHIVHLFRRKNARALRISVIVTLIVVAFMGLHRSSDYIEIDLHKIPYFYSQESNVTTSSVDFDVGQFRKILGLTMDHIRDFSPDGELDRTRGKDCQIGDFGVEDTGKYERVTRTELLKCINVETATRDKLRDLHKSFLKVLSDAIIPNYPKEIYKGEGIVFVAGGKFTMFVMPAVKAIRANAGANFPIEIMIPPENNEESFCENILPLLDPTGLTRCVFMDKLFDRTTLKNVKGYQLKALALLASSFEKCLLLDSDNYVVNSIDKIFSSEIFEEFGLALWPDYWRRLHHPVVYEVVGMEVDTAKRVRYSIDSVSPPELYKPEDMAKVPFHDFDGTIPDGGTESGQLLIDKTKHLDTIILSLYYNYNGPSYYYPLLGQGFAGEGDKDTFALAAKSLSANAVPRPYYQVKARVRPMGHWTHKKDEVLVLEKDNAPASEQQFRGVAMLQHDLESDFRAYKKARNDLQSKLMDELKALREKVSLSEAAADLAEVDKQFWREQRGKGYSIENFILYFKDIPVTFVHSHLPKYDPWEYASAQDMTFDGKKTMDRHKDEPNFKPTHHGQYRMYNDDFRSLTDYDLELANWMCFREYACRDNGYENFSYLLEKVKSTEDGEKSFSDMCKYINQRVQMLEKTTWDGARIS